MTEQKELTSEQIREFWEVKVRLKSYYKYSFTFDNDEGYEVSVGGSSDEIYKCFILAGKEYTIHELFDECGGSLYVYLNNNLIYENLW